MAKKEYQSPVAKLSMFTSEDIVRTSNVSTTYEFSEGKHTVGGFEIGWLDT